MLHGYNLSYTCQSKTELKVDVRSRHSPQLKKLVVLKIILKKEIMFLFVFDKKNIL